MAISISFQSLQTSTPTNYKVSNGMTLEEFLNDEVSISNVNKVTVVVDGMSVEPEDFAGYTLREGQSIVLRPKNYSSGLSDNTSSSTISSQTDSQTDSQNA